ncbi:MAG: MerR family transcriptional regulator [Oscillospiraceae bacterium]|nr:MerR family transcriptional regulator [Oscillospiraceae bacterium]
MSQYTTGEIAKLCEISVRTVQFYDTKDLIKPTELTEGGRRLYSDADLNKFRLICMLKSLGLTLESIKGILESKNSNRVLFLLLDEQTKLLSNDIENKQKQLNAICIIKENLFENSRIPVNSIRDIERLMNSKKKLRNTHFVMIAVGVLMDVIQIASLILWIAKGIWQPFAIGMPVVILLGIFMTWMYIKNTDYICPECSKQFKPSTKAFMFSKHTPKTRKLTCPDCGYEGYCVEVASE